MRLTVWIWSNHRRIFWGQSFCHHSCSHPCYKTQLSRTILNRYWQYNWGYNWVFVHHSYSNYTVNLHCALTFYQLMVISSRQYYGTHHIGSLFFDKWLWPVEDCLEKLTLWQAERGKKIQALISIIKLLELSWLLVVCISTLPRRLVNIQKNTPKYSAKMSNKIHSF